MNFRMNIEYDVSFMANIDVMALFVLLNKIYTNFKYIPKIETFSNYM